MPSSWIEVAHRFGSQVAVIPPPYRSSSPLHCGGTDDVPLGSLVVGKGDVTIAVLAELTSAVHRWPWIVPCLDIPIKHEPLEPLLMLVTELRGRLVVVKQPFAGRDYELERVIASVRRRALPAAHGLAQWVSMRLGKNEMEAPLRSQFREALEGIPASASTSISTFSRLFTRYGIYTSRDWRAVVRLCMHAAGGADPRGCAAPTLPLRTASHYTKKYLAVSYHVMAERLGWEWVLEGALRVGRYL